MSLLIFQIFILSHLRKCVFILRGNRVCIKYNFRDRDADEKSRGGSGSEGAKNKLIRYKVRRREEAAAAAKPRTDVARDSAPFYFSRRHITR